MTLKWVNTSIDILLSKREAFIKSVILTPSSANKRGDCTFYDGESTSDPKLIKILGESGQSTQFNFDPPLKTNRGLYLDVGGDVGEILVQFGWSDI